MKQKDKNVHGVSESSAFHVSCYIPHGRTGQSLVEILIAISIGSIMILGAISVIVPAIKSATETSRVQITTGLGKELMDNVRVWADTDWHAIESLPQGSENPYYLVFETTSFTAVAGLENVMVGGSSNIRYFYVEDVLRDGGGNIVVSGGANDPSSKKVTVDFRPIHPAFPKAIITYLTRSRNATYLQTDWSGGAGVTAPVTSVGNSFANSTNVNFTGTPGSLRMNGL